MHACKHGPRLPTRASTPTHAAAYTALTPAPRGPTSPPPSKAAHAPPSPHPHRHRQHANPPTVSSPHLLTSTLLQASSHTPPSPPSHSTVSACPYLCARVVCVCVHVCGGPSWPSSCSRPGPCINNNTPPPNTQAVSHNDPGSPLRLAPAPSSQPPLSTHTPAQAHTRQTTTTPSTHPPLVGGPLLGGLHHGGELAPSPPSPPPFSTHTPSSPPPP
jgi:hypothetical protein